MPRLIEFLIVLVTLPLWGGLTLLIAGFLFLTARPVFFKQVRPGYKGQPFTVTKFRTMRAGTEEDAVRLTRIGRFLRATSLDELPELWLVLTGKMALVGPRPLLMEYLDQYTEEEHHRHDVRPGITGWAQVHGRNAITLAQKVQYDLEYVRRRSTALDFKILFITLFHLRGN